MGKDRHNLERLLRAAYDLQCRQRALATGNSLADKKSLAGRVFGVIEQPLILGALFAVGGIVGALLFTPAFILCAICILLGFHRSGIVAGLPLKVQLPTYLGLVFFLSAGGYFLYGTLDKALGRFQTEFAKKVADLNKEKGPVAKTPDRSSPGKDGTASPPKKSGPAFSVIVEDRIFSPGGNTPTHFRILQSNSNGGCALFPVDLLLFIRITNLQDSDAMISAYNVEIGGKEYQRVSMLMGALEWVPDKGTIPKVGTTIGWEQGTGIGHLSIQEVGKADPSRAASVTNAQILDWELGGKYLGPKKFARGWAFFEYAKDRMMLPVSDIKVKVTDQSGTIFSYKIPHKNPEGNANGDVLPRITTIGPLTDLSRCSLER